MSLYNKYRPTKLDQLAGNEATIEALQNQVENNSLSHVLLFTGDRGCGKTTLSRILSVEVGADELSIKEINGANKNKIDDIRELIEQCKYQSMNGKPTVYIYDECHRLTPDSQAALLKLLEDTPSHIYFFLATTNPEKLSKAIKSRCMIYGLESLKTKDMLKLLMKISKKEDLEVSKDILKTIIEYAEGSPRTAIQMLEKVSSIKGAENQIKAIEGALEEQNPELFELAKVLVYNTNPKWESVGAVLTGLKKEDPEGIRRFILACASNQVLKKGCTHAANVLECFSEPTYDIGFPGITLAAISVVS